MTVRRSRCRVSRTSGKLPTTTTAAQTETSRPVCASLTPSPALISGSTAVGTISAVTMTNVAPPSTRSDGQGMLDVGRAAVPTVSTVGFEVVVSSMIRR